MLLYSYINDLTLMSWLSSFTKNSKIRGVQLCGARSLNSAFLAQHSRLTELIATGMRYKQRAHNAA